MKRRPPRSTISLHSHRAFTWLRRRLLVKERLAAEPVIDLAQQRAAEIDQELSLARDIQQGLLLEAAPHLAGWELSAISLPARVLGGDLYGFLNLQEGWQGIMIGDVSGKGLPAALRMAVARTVFRHEARRLASPSATLAAVNQGILSEIPQGMVTMLYACLDLAKGELRVANAGQTFPLIVNGHVHELELSGLPLGVDSDSDYAEATIELQPGDSVILYTDGVLEAENSTGEIFTYERLAALVSANARLKPRAIVARLLQELRAWSGTSRQTDDITIVALRRRLARLNDELRSVVDDVLGEEPAAILWATGGEQSDMNLTDGGANEWLEALPNLIRLAQGMFNRGQTRELQQQLRLAIEEYRASGSSTTN